MEVVDNFVLQIWTLTVSAYHQNIAPRLHQLLGHFCPSTHV